MHVSLKHGEFTMARITRPAGDRNRTGERITLPATLHGNYVTNTHIRSCNRNALVWKETRMDRPGEQTRTRTDNEIAREHTSLHCTARLTDTTKGFVACASPSKSPVRTEEGGHPRQARHHPPIAHLLHRQLGALPQAVRADAAHHHRACHSARHAIGPGPRRGVLRRRGLRRRHDSPVSTCADVMRLRALLDNGFLLAGLVCGCGCGCCASCDGLHAHTPVHASAALCFHPPRHRCPCLRA